MCLLAVSLTVSAKHVSEVLADMQVGLDPFKTFYWFSDQFLKHKMIIQEYYLNLGKFSLVLSFG